jgi:hypothetical protein
MSVKLGRLLPGTKIVPERIRENRDEYLRALRAADAAWDLGNLSVRSMVEFLGRLLREQLRDAEREIEGISPVP